MTNFIFNSADTSSSNLSIGTFYAHCVTTVPAITNTTVANLALSNAAGYTPLILTGLSYDPTRWTFADAQFPSYNFTVTPIGIVICKRAGVNPAASDPVICYSDFTNSLAQIITPGTGTYIISLLFSATQGAINFLNRYRYSSGAYINSEPIPPGSIYLLGSNNNTVGFTNPAGTKISTIRRNGSSIFEPISFASDRNNLNDSARLITLDFINYRLQVGTVGLQTINFTSSNVSIYGSNTIATLNSATTLDPSFWTLLGTIPVIASNAMNLVTVNNPTYWQYIKIEQTDGGTFAITEVEFYSSSISSLNINLQ